MPLPAGIVIRRAVPGDAPACFDIRGKTRQNALSPEGLAEYGVTVQTWQDEIRSDDLPGFVATQRGSIVGYCYAVKETGEIAVLALLPEFECQGIGRELLARMVAHLRELGFKRLFLGCSPDPASRSHGFYRHLGWNSTKAFDSDGDEILELQL